MSGDEVPANSGMRSRGVGDARGSEAEERLSDTSATPQLTVLSKNTSPQEIAALVVALATLQPTTAPPPQPRSRWAHPARMTRRPLAPGHDGWRTSGLP